MLITSPLLFLLILSYSDFFLLSKPSFKLCTNSSYRFTTSSSVFLFSIATSSGLSTNFLYPYLPTAITLKIGHQIMIYHLQSAIQTGQSQSQRIPARTTPVIIRPASSLDIVSQFFESPFAPIIIPIMQPQNQTKANHIS